MVAWYGRYVSKYTIGTLYWLTRLEQAWEIESCQSRITSCCLQSRGGRELRKVCLSCILLLLLDGWSKLCSLTCLLSLCNCAYYVSSCFIFQISLTLATFDNIMHARVFLFLHQLETKNRIWNTKFLCLDFCCSRNHKREDASLSLFFLNGATTKIKTKKSCTWFLDVYWKKL